MMISAINSLVVDDLRVIWILSTCVVLNLLIKLWYIWRKIWCRKASIWNMSIIIQSLMICVVNTKRKLVGPHKTWWEVSDSVIPIHDVSWLTMLFNKFLTFLRQRLVCDSSVGCSPRARRLLMSSSKVATRPWRSSK